MNTVLMMGAIALENADSTKVFAQNVGRVLKKMPSRATFDKFGARSRQESARQARGIATLSPNFCEAVPFSNTTPHNPSDGPVFPERTAAMSDAYDQKTAPRGETKPAEFPRNSRHSKS